MKRIFSLSFLALAFLSAGCTSLPADHVNTCHYDWQACQSKKQARSTEPAELPWNPYATTAQAPKHGTP